MAAENEAPIDVPEEPSAISEELVAVFEVIGDEDGIAVRAEKDTSSANLDERLAAGALIVPIKFDEEEGSMQYEKIAGEGPEMGWVSTKFQGQEVLRLVPEEELAELMEADHDVDSGDLAMQLYCLRFGEADEDEFSGLDETEPEIEELFEDDEEKALAEAELLAELEQDLSTEEPTSDVAEDSSSVSDAELLVCKHCGLPVGSMAYNGGSEAGVMHGECVAQLALLELKEEEEKRSEEAMALKKARREEYDIGWKVERIPSNVGSSAKLGLNFSQGMYCLVYNPETRTVGVAPTIEPCAAVNLEYLAIALQVRRRDNREPLFSLDPLEGQELNSKESMQVKRFEPAWIAGTSVGEILFQSDYHLKELSMGEHAQPVLGMKSCHEYSDEDRCETNWNAREWFVVRKAEVQMSEDNALLPNVKMGVEAREQILGEHGFEDVKTTRANHPLVRYAESFTHNFDLIAERKSVVFHLRELAKASVLAKFLMEQEVEMDEAWFSLAEDSEEACCLEIPQLWNDRARAQIRVQDGKVMNADTEFGKSLHSLYGGVQFGLDKFQLSGARQPARMMSAGLAARQFVQPARHLSATLSAGLATRQFQRSFGPMGVQPARVSAGVGLDKFALSAGRQPARMMSAGLAARQFVQPARHLSATLSAGLATRQFQRSFGPMGVQPARVSAGVGLDKFALSAGRQPARMMSAGLAARQFVQPARHLSATLSAGLATRQFQRSFGPMGVQPARVSAGVGLDKFALSAGRQPARMMSAGLAARQFVQPARHLSATLSAGLATRQFQRSFGPMGVQPARVSAGVGLDKFALSAGRQPARMMSAGLAARQFVQPARHLSATLSAGLATRQFQRSFGPMGVQPARVSAGVGLDKFALSAGRQPARMMSAGLAARQFVQPARHLSATLSAGLATRQFQRSFGPMGVQPARVSAGVGLDKFALSAGRQPARMMSAGLAARQFVQPARHLSATLSAGLATRQFQRSFGPMGVQPARVSGVDLNLDEFNLSDPTEIARADIVAKLDEGVDISEAFWMNIEDDMTSMFNEEDRLLLNQVFNAALSDRRAEGDRFVPPDTSREYVQRLRALVQEEMATQEQRMDHFFSKDFEQENAGPLFPLSWASNMEISRDGKCRPQLHERKDFAQAHMLEDALESVVPGFDKITEDGSRFSIYRIGSLEVRVIAEPDCEPVIGAVFSVHAPSESKSAIPEQEEVVKVTEYVERVGVEFQVYVALETEQKNILVVEELEDGTLRFEENPSNLEDRTSLAKVLRTAECSRTTVAAARECDKNIYSQLTGDSATSVIQAL